MESEKLKHLKWQRDDYDRKAKEHGARCEKGESHYTRAQLDSMGSMREWYLNGIKIINSEIAALENV